MQSLQRLRKCVFLAPLLLLFATLPALAEEQPRLRVEDYVISAELFPKTHKLVAHASVRFTALDDIATATFELHNGLRPTRVTDEDGHALSVERVTQDSTIRVALPSGMAKGSSSTLNFDYEGTLLSADDSPVPGLKLAYVGEDISYLLYGGRWFPVSGFGTDRFTSKISVTVPAGYTVIGSGTENGIAAPPAAEEKPAPPSPRRSTRTAASSHTEEPAPKAVTGSKTYTFTWDKPSFPGTIIAGQFETTTMTAVGAPVKVYFRPNHKTLAASYGEAAVKELIYFINAYGPPVSSRMNVVEFPDDTVPSAWAPEIAAIGSHEITPKVNYRLLANAIAHQWWGVQVSPATKDDWWLCDGFARYSETSYVGFVAGQGGYQEALKDIHVRALAYDAVPLARVNTLDSFSPEFQALVADKGASILGMLRWVMGDGNFDKTMRQFATDFAGKPAHNSDFQKIAEQAYGSNLTWFFTQWLDSTGAPEFKDKYVIYRLGNGRGFRVVGSISQDLDLFRMPVDLKIDTDGKTEIKRIQVVGTSSEFQVDTFGKPRRVTIDPDNDVLQNSPQLQERTSIMRGELMVKSGDLAGALKEFQKSLDTNRNSSLAHYRIADVFFLQHNYQSAANAYRESLDGDGEPNWTEVWCHIRLGQIFDITGQRERATNEYRQALQTNDNTLGALDQARKYLQAPYQPDKPKEGAD